MEVNSAMEVKGQALHIVAMNFIGTPEQEVEFNKYYNKIHIPDVLKVPGFLSGIRYEAVNPTPDQRKYIAIYEIENEKMMNEAVENPLMEEARADFRGKYGDLRSDLLIHRWKLIGH